ncbi:hypothetical protein M5K25_010925 [Dendrobium thyrsiflorum]|uniref:Uncharacterized protein n=1 Tax=Dendrobium thyrsiflorum TaxID=117978 RepID=A0ABD0V1W7_DENTH
MTPVKSFMTVKLGEGAKVQFPEAVLNTGYAGATIQFGTISEVMQFQQFLPENTVSAPTVKGVAKKPSVEEKAPKRASVFTRLSIASAPAPTIQKEISDPKLKPVIVNSTGQNIIPEEVPAENVTEIPDASPKLSRKARRKANARLRANGWMPNTLQEPSLQLEANIPTNNDFEPLKWVKRNDDKGKLKKSFWETSHQQSLPPKKEESASSKIYKILKAVKDRNLQRRLRKSVNEVISSNVARPHNNKFSMRPYREEFKSPPYYREPRNFCPNTGRYPYYGRKQSGEPFDSPYEKGYNRRYDEGRPRQWHHKTGHSKAHSDVGGHRYSTPKRQQKLSPDEETSVDVTKLEKEESPVYNESPDSPVIHWKRRSQLRDDPELDENDDYYDDDYDDEVKGYIDPMDIEVVRMVDHVPERANQRTPQPEEVEEEEAEEVIKRLQLEMQSMQQKKDQEIHHLNARLDEMSNMMKQLFGQLGMMDTTNQPPVVNSQGNVQGNVQTIPDVLVTPDGRLEELQEPTLITPKEDEKVSKAQIENLITQKELLDRVAKFERLPRPRSVGFNYNNNPPGKGKQVKTFDSRRNDVNTAFSSFSDKKEKEDSMNQPKMEKTNVISSVPCQSTEDKKEKALQEDEGGWETFISKKTKQMMNVLLAIEGIRRKSALELEVDPRLLSSKNPVAGGPSSSKKKPLKYFKDQKGKHKSGSRSQKEKKKKLARKKTMIQKYIDSTDEYQQPPRRPVMLEEYMADLFLNSESEEEESIPIETCRVISKRGGRAARGRNIPLDICKADVKMSSKEVHRTPAPFTDSDEELHFPVEESDHKGKKILKERCPKLGSSSDSEEVEDMKISKNSQTEASSSSEVTQIQLRSGKQVSLPQKKMKDKEKNIQLNEAVVPQESLKPKVASANVDYNLLSHLRKLPALLSIYDALLMSKDLRKHSSRPCKILSRKLKDKGKSKSKQISSVPHLGSDTEEDDISTSFKPLVIGKRRSELSTVPFDYEANHANKVRCSSKPSTEGEEEFLYQPKGTKKSQEEGDPGPSSISKKLQKVSISMIRVSEDQISTDIIKIVPTPAMHSKTLTASSNTNIEMLKTFYVPPKRGLNERGSVFYKSKVIPHHNTHEIECEDDWKHGDIWVIIPQYPSPIIRKLIEKRIFFVQTRGKEIARITSSAPLQPSDFASKERRDRTPPLLPDRCLAFDFGASVAVRLRCFARR